jgi:hypothetical protein
MVMKSENLSNYFNQCGSDAMLIASEMNNYSFATKYFNWGCLWKTFVN